MTLEPDFVAQAQVIISSITTKDPYEYPKQVMDAASRIREFIKRLPDGSTQRDALMHLRIALIAEILGEEKRLLEHTCPLCGSKIPPRNRDI